MGNDICCRDDPFKNDLPNQSLPSVSKKTAFRLPKLTQEIEDHLQKYRPLADKLPHHASIKKFGEEIYEGEIDNKGRPEGYGKMYRYNGSLFIGRFERGVANGDGYYLKPDGSYYQGKIKDNKANDSKAIYWSPSFEYSGNIVNNLFEGEGREKGKKYEFNGIYKGGQKSYGTMRWNEGQIMFQYTGQFNANGLFNGKGNLKQYGVGAYSGEFQNGEKHGHGEFTFEDGKKFIGQYFYGVRSGHGKSLNKKGQVTYEGNWKNGLPHGLGRARTVDGKYIERQFIEGLDKEMLEIDDD